MREQRAEGDVANLARPLAGGNGAVTLEAAALQRDRVARAICQGLLVGALQPGQRLVETKLAADLGVGRNSVREALQQLEQQGIVVGSPYKGVRIVELGPRQIEEVYSVRAVLETFASQRALSRGRVTDDLLDDLRGLLVDMEIASRSGAVMQQVDLDMAFHGRIAACADHALLLSILKGLRQQARIIIVLRLRGMGPLQIVESHRAVLDALSTRDAQRIETATMAHILKSGELMAESKPTNTDPLTRVTKGSGAVVPSASETRARI